jgi:hypothetical protein
MEMNKAKELTIFHQFAGLKRDFSFGVSTIVKGKTLEWVGKLKSSPNGGEYKVKLTYEAGDRPKVYVLDPMPLDLATGKKTLPQRLCLYYPDGKEWNRSRPIQTVMIWAIEWLYHYELWLITAEWLGGGTVHSSSKMDITTNDKNRRV